MSTFYCKSTEGRQRQHDARMVQAAFVHDGINFTGRALIYEVCRNCGAARREVRVSDVVMGVPRVTYVVWTEVPGLHGYSRPANLYDVVGAKRASAAVVAAS